MQISSDICYLTLREILKNPHISQHMMKILIVIPLLINFMLSNELLLFLSTGSIGNGNPVLNTGIGNDIYIYKLNLLKPKVTWFSCKGLQSFKKMK